MAVSFAPAAPLTGQTLVTLDAAKAAMRVTSEDEDDFIAGTVLAAIGWVERYTGRALVSRAWTATYDAFAWPLALPIGPVTAIGGVTYLDPLGVEQPVSGVRQVGQGLWPAVNTPWPVPLPVGNVITVQFTAGYAAGACPPELIAAVKMLAAHLFLNREAVLTVLVATEVPLGVRALCDLYRTPVIG